MQSTEGIDPEMPGNGALLARCGTTAMLRKWLFGMSLALSAGSVQLIDLIGTIPLHTVERFAQ